MNEQMPIRNEDGQINDLALAHEMAIAEDPHRESIQRARDIAKELVDEASAAD